MTFVSKIICKIRKILRKLINGINKRKEEIVRGLSFSIYMLLAIGILSYIPLAYFGTTEPPGFELAIVSAIIGGLLFSGRFSGMASEDAELVKKVRQIGILYLVATIAFVFLALFLQLAKVEFESIIANWTVILVNIVSMSVSVISFSWATAELAYIIPKLWSIQK